ncbi:MAG TPA: hypothetical protein VF121_14775 [Thermoanaerobaculia bacterium]|nr:hypothetical protein [Thermoanaerobaculia bacterium]
MTHGHRKKKPKPPVQRVQFTVKLEPPLLRQIIDDSPRPRREVALEHLWLWLNATLTHLFRFRRSLRREFRLASTSGPTQRLVSQRVRIDEHMLLAAAANLQKATALFANDLPGLSLPPELADLLKNLRNVYEHWEDYMPHVATVALPKGSGPKLKAAHPEAHFWAIEIWPDDVKLACVLSLRELQQHLRRLGRDLRKFT